MFSQQKSGLKLEGPVGQMDRLLAAVHVVPDLASTLV